MLLILKNEEKKIVKKRKRKKWKVKKNSQSIYQTLNKYSISINIHFLNLICTKKIHIIVDDKDIISHILN